MQVLGELKHIAIHNTIQRILSSDISALDLANIITFFKSQHKTSIFSTRVIIDELEDLMFISNERRMVLL